MGIYNCATTLAHGISSILRQSYTNWELILCDDCSTDGTLALAEQYARDYPNIRLLRNDRNMRLSHSLNRCLSVARGTLIARMDADDISLPDRFEKQVRFLTEHPDYVVVGGGVIPFDEDGEKALRLPPEHPGVRDLVWDTPFYHPTIMMRKSAYDDLGGYLVSSRTRKGQDIDLWFRLFAANFRGYNLQEPLLMYRESVSDYRSKRDLRSALGVCRTKWHGFRLNRFPLHLYPFVLKPLVAALVPKRIMHRLHNPKPRP